MDSLRTIRKIGLAALLVLLCNPTRAQVQVYLFVYPDCPVCRYYIPLVHQMAQTYSPEFCTFHYIVPAQNIPLKDQRAYKKELKKKLNYRNEKILIDVYNTFALQLKATITPEVFVMGEDGYLKYSGAIDNKYITVAKYRQQADEHYLASALQGLLNNDSIVVKRTQPVGCIIH
jgi:protein-disulfide isomerase